MFARMIVTLGPEYADENNRQRRTIAKGIRDLGKKKTRRVPFIAKISATILSMPAAHSLIDAIFAESGHQDLSDEFANLLERSAAADPFACRRLADIAQAVASDISPPRGRKISVATAMHELALEILRLSGKPQDVGQRTRRLHRLRDRSYETRSWQPRFLSAASMAPNARPVAKGSETSVGILSVPGGPVEIDATIRPCRVS